jgi:hypothetical protein
LQFLASCFLIDILGFGLMGNHFHCLLRNRPDLARQLSDVEVLLHWWRLSAASRAADGSTKPISRRRLKKMLADRETIRQYRRRLSSISWFMSYLKQPLAQLANQQDGVTGCFWEGRFHSEKVDSLKQLLAAMVYIDLNPIRAGQAQTPEQSRYTGAFERMKALHQRRQRAAHAKGRPRDAKQQQQDALDEQLHEQIDAWLSPVQFDESREQPINVNSAEDGSDHLPETDWDAAAAEAARWSAKSRASERGILPMSLEKYLLLLDWTGRQLRSDKRGKIPAGLPSILARLGLSGPGAWLSILKDYADSLLSKYSASVNQASELDLCHWPDPLDADLPGPAFL